MPRILPLYLLSLLVFFTACKKDEQDVKPAPGPALEGRWEYKGTTSYDYDATGKITAQKSSVYPQAPFYMDITATTLHYADVKTNTPWNSNPWQIRREGDMLYYLPGAGYQARITDLTEHTLTLRFEGEWGNPKATYTHAFEDHYVR